MKKSKLIQQKKLQGLSMHNYDSMKFILSKSFLLVLIVFLFASCDEDENVDPNIDQIVNVWKISKSIRNDAEENVLQYDGLRFQLKADNTYFFEFPAAGYTETGTWIYDKKANQVVETNDANNAVNAITFIDFSEDQLHFTSVDQYGPVETFMVPVNDIDKICHSWKINDNWHNGIKDQDGIYEGLALTFKSDFTCEFIFAEGDTPWEGTWSYNPDTKILTETWTVGAELVNDLKITNLEYRDLRFTHVDQIGDVESHMIPTNN